MATDPGAPPPDVDTPIAPPETPPPSGEPDQPYAPEEVPVEAPDFDQPDTGPIESPPPIDTTL